MENFIRPVAAGLIIIIFLLGLHYIGWLSPVESALVKVTSPLFYFSNQISGGLKFFYGSWLARRDLLTENEQLKERLKNYQINQSVINSLKADNKLLQKELNFARQKKAKLLAARIITGVSDPVSRSVIIDQGRNAGVEKGLAVVADDGVLIGKVYEVHDFYSQVLLLTDDKSLVAATVQNQDQTIGIVEGQFGLSYSMTNIPQDSEIKEGDLVVTSGLEGKVPKGLLIAEVENVNIVESEIFKSATLRPIIPFDNLSYVLVIVP